MCSHLFGLDVASMRQGLRRRPRAQRSSPRQQLRPSHSTPRRAPVMIILIIIVIKIMRLILILRAPPCPLSRTRIRPPTQGKHTRTYRHTHPFNRPHRPCRLWVRGPTPPAPRSPNRTCKAAPPPLPAPPAPRALDLPPLPAPPLPAPPRPAPPALHLPAELAQGHYWQRAAGCRRRSARALGIACMHAHTLTRGAV